MTKTIRIFILILFSVNFGLAQTTDQLLATADSLIEAENFAEAIPYYDKLIALDASNEHYFRARAYAKGNLGNIDQSEVDLKKALEINPDCSVCYSNLGRIESSRANIEKALELLNTAIEKDENNDFAYYIRGRIKEYNNDQVGAMFDYNKAINLSPDEAIYYSERGRNRMSSGLKSLAIRDLNKAYTLDSNDVDVVYHRAQYFTTVEDWDNALLDLNRCIELDPGHYVYYGAKGTVFEILERHTEAIENYTLSISLDSTKFLTYMNRATAYYSLENMDGFCDDNKAALRLIEKTASNQAEIDYLEGRIDELCNTSKKSYYYQRGIAAFNLGEFETGISYYTDGLKLFPNSPLLLSFRGNAYRAIGKDALAIADYNNCLSHKAEMSSEVNESRSFKENPNVISTYLAGSIATVYMNISESTANLGKYETALSYSDSAINLLLEIPNQLEIAGLLASNYNTRGVIYNVQGNYEKAINDFQEAIRIDAFGPLPYVNMALASINNQNGLNYKQINMGFFVHSDYKGSQGITMPIVNKQKVDKTNLIVALTACDRAIELDKNLAFAYLVRAQIKLLLDEPGFCIDVLTAKELGILDAEEQLGVSCE